MNTLTTVRKGVASNRIINIRSLSKQSAAASLARIQSRLRQGSLLSRHSHDRTFISSQAQAKAQGAAQAKGAALKQQLQQQYKYHYDRGVAPVAAYAALCALTIATCTISNNGSEQQQTKQKPHQKQKQQESLHQQSESQSIISTAKQGWGSISDNSISLLQQQTGMCQCESVAASNSSSSSSLNLKVNRTNTQLPNANVNATANTSTNDSTNTNTNSNTSQPRNVMLHRLRSIRSRSLADKYDVDWKTVLGEGAYGSVHPARLLATGEKVALKKITKRYTDTSSFSRETDALLRIYHNGGHPNISGMRDMYEDYDHFYLVMDLVSGGEMFDHLIEFGAYSEADAARLMSEVASALAFLHGVGVVHADLKPENLLLCSRKRLDGTIKMIDFGCAVVEKDQYSDEDDDKKSVGGSVVKDDGDGDGNGDDKKEDSNTDTESGKGSNSGTSGGSSKDPIGVHRTLQSWIEALNKKVQEEAISEKQPESTGTTAYWPPERFNSPRSPDHAADMWAVGVILFIMLTGVHPFDLTGVATDAAIAEQIKKDPSPPITQGLTGHLSPSAINLIRMLLDKNPADRLTANEMLEHPWIVGDEASTEVIEGSAEKLGKFRDLRAIIEAGIFSILIEKGSREMAMSEYTPKMVYKDDRRGSSDASKRPPASSVLKRAFEAFDQGGKGFVSADDLSRVVTETTGQSLSDSEKNEMIHPYNTDTAGSSGLSLSSFSKVAAGLKHKHFPRGHIVFRAGEIGDAMYFINSGKVEIQTKKGQLIHILRHGDFFGEGSLLEEDNRRFSTAKCATPVDLIKIKQSEFKRYIENSKSAHNTLLFRWKARTLADAKAFIRLQTNVKTVEMNKGDIVYKEGDIGRSMYFVDEECGGELDVKHGDVTVHKYGQGESFGESSLLLEKPRSSTVFCSSEKCLLHEMTGADFLAYLESSPKTKDALLNMCRKRLFKKAVKKYSMEHNRGFTNDDLTKAFQLADADGNGILDINEIRKVMHAMDPSIPEAEIVELMKFIDVDADGSLSFRDFKRLFRSFEFQ